MTSGSVVMSYKWSFPLLKDAIVILRSNIKRCLKMRIIVINPSERNILRISFINSVVYYMTAILINNVENMVLIYRSVS